MSFKKIKQRDLPKVIKKPIKLKAASKIKEIIPLEHEIQISLFQEVQYHLAKVPELSLLTAYPLQRGNDVYWLTQRLKEGAKKNWPDLHLPISRHGYHALFIEVKRKNNPIKEDQIKMLRKLQNEGNLAISIETKTHINILKYIMDYISGRLYTFDMIQRYLD